MLFCTFRTSEAQHNHDLSAFAAVIVSANTRPGSHLTMRFKIIIANTWATFPPWRVKLTKSLKKIRIVRPLKDYQDRTWKQYCIKLFKY